MKCVGIVFVAFSIPRSWVQEDTLRSNASHRRVGYYELHRVGESSQTRYLAFITSNEK